MQLQVFRISWSMGTYGAASAKPQIAFSNARAISGLWIGRLDKKATPQILTTRFVNKRGKRCFTGNKKLKASQPHPKSSDEQIVYHIASINMCTMCACEVFTILAVVPVS